MTLGPINSLDAVSAATDVASDPVNIQYVTLLSLQGVISGGSSPTGTLKIQVSNDKPLSPSTPFVPTNWSDLASGSLSFTDNATKVTNALTVSYYWARVYWDASSGTGTLTATLFGNAPA